jgi:hypothetical protein
LAALTRPEHVTDLLGPLPERITETERWRQAAGAVEVYRSRWNIGGMATIGAEPTNPEQRAHLDNLAATLASAGFTSPASTSGQQAEQPWLASLWSACRLLTASGTKINLEREVTVEPPAWSRSSSRSSRDSGYDGGRDDGFGL